MRLRVVSVRRTGYGLVLLVGETEDGRTVEGSGLTEESAYLNACAKAREVTR